MRMILFSLGIACLVSSGCSILACDRVFPKVTWYWTAEAKRCRASHELGEKLAKEWAGESQPKQPAK
jgi:hypothetical protein